MPLELTTALLTLIRKGVNFVQGIVHCEGGPCSPYRSQYLAGYGRLARPPRDLTCNCPIKSQFYVNKSICIYYYPSHIERGVYTFYSCRLVTRLIGFEQVYFFCFCTFNLALLKEIFWHLNLHYVMQLTSFRLDVQPSNLKFCSIALKTETLKTFKVLLI